MTSMYVRLIVKDAEQSLRAAIRATEGLSGAAMLLDQALLLVQDALIELDGEEN